MNEETEKEHRSKCGSLPVTRRRLQVHVEEDSALALQLRIAKDNLRRSPLAASPPPHWEHDECQSEKGTTLEYGRDEETNRECPVRVDHRGEGV